MNAASSDKASSERSSSDASLSERLAERLWGQSGEGEKKIFSPVVVAEMSTNHRGSLAEARALVRAAKGAGADAVKIQSYEAGDLTIRSERPEFRLRHPLWRGKRLFDLYEQGGLPASWHAPLWEDARERGIVLFSSVFSERRLEMLSSFSDFAYKVASGEVVDLALLEAVARTGRGVILSTGMADATEIGRAVDVVRKAGNEKIVLLHCLSAYPADSLSMNLRAIETLRRRFGCAVGLSDHTRDERAAVLATGLGVCMIEKHFAIERREADLDYAFSLDADEFARFVAAVQDAFEMLGGGALEASSCEEESLSFRRSLYVVCSVRCGERFTRENVRAIRPNAGLAPFHLPRVLSCRATRDLEIGLPLSEDMLSSG